MMQIIFFAGTIKSLTIPGFEKGKDQSVKWVQYWYKQIIHGYLKYNPGVNHRPWANNW
jgi:hypothetical protein